MAKTNKELFNERADRISVIEKRSVTHEWFMDLEPEILGLMQKAREEETDNFVECVRQLKKMDQEENYPKAMIFDILEGHFKASLHGANAGKGSVSQDDSSLTSCSSGLNDIAVEDEPVPSNNFWICPTCKTKKNKSASKYSLYYSVIRDRTIYGCYQCYLNEKRSREKQC